MSCWNADGRFEGSSSGQEVGMRVLHAMAMGLDFTKKRVGRLFSRE